MFHLLVFTRNYHFQAIHGDIYLYHHFEFWRPEYKRMELMSNGTRYSLDGPLHGSFRTFLDPYIVSFYLSDVCQNH